MNYKPKIKVWIDGKPRRLDFNQVEAIKGTLRTDANNLNNEIEKFQLRWDAIKSKEENLD